MSKKKKTRLTGEAFDALSAAEKERIFQELERETPAQRRARAIPPDRAEKAFLGRLAKRLRPGRPKTGRATKVVSVSVETALLAEADAFAKRQGVGRSDLFMRGLKLAMAGG